MRIREEDIQIGLYNYFSNSPLVWDVYREVKCPLGKVDLLIYYKDKSTELIEVKNIKQIKHAIGQVIAYTKYYPVSKKSIAYFTYDTREMSKQPTSHYFNIAKENDIRLFNAYSLVDSDGLVNKKVEKEEINYSCIDIQNIESLSNI